MGGITMSEHTAPSRRDLVVLAAAAMAGAGLSLVAPSAAFANTGNMQFGGPNDAGTAQTFLTSSHTGYTFEALNTGTGSALWAQISNAASSGTVLYATTNGTGNAILGESNNGSSGSPAIVGTTAGSSGSANAVWGFAGNPAGQQAAVLGTSASLTPAARGVKGKLDANAAAGAAVEGVTRGSNAAVGVLGTVELGGTGPAIKATSAGTGEALQVEITNAASTAVAAKVITAGTGDALRVETSASASAGTAAVRAYAPSATYAVSASAGANGIALYGSSPGGTALHARTDTSQTNVNPTAEVFRSCAGGGFALHAWAYYATGTSTAFGARSDGLGPAVLAEIANPGNDRPAVTARTSGTGYALHAEGGKAQLYLKPAATQGQPQTGSHLKGEVLVDSAARIWKCTADGTPGTWVEVGAETTVPAGLTTLLPVPVRVVDTRKGVGGFTGPMNKLTWYNFGNFTASGVPAEAKGLVGNLTMVAPAGQMLNGRGWMAILPAAHVDKTVASDPGVSTVNAGANTVAIANQFTVGLGTGGYTGKISLVFDSAQKLHALVDITGYII
jgi:hypothetical protein